MSEGQFVIRLFGASAAKESNMEQPANAATGRGVRESGSLSPGELKYINQRKQTVLRTLNKLGVNCSEDSVPHIALLGSGGGQRAATAVLGSLCQMVEDGLLDSMLYLGGVSGTTWSMSSLYCKEHWTVDLESALALLTGPGVELGDALDWLADRAEEENFSLTDIWGLMTSAGIMKEMDLRRLSEEANRDAKNPYPVYCAVERHCFSNKLLKGQWFEVTPHEAGFIELDLFIQTSLLGSKFKNGELVEEQPEMDMVKLQGVCGSALADWEQVKEYVAHWLHVPDFFNPAVAVYLQVFHILKELVNLLTHVAKDDVSRSAVKSLHLILEEADQLLYNEWNGPQMRASMDQTAYFKEKQEGLLEMVKSWDESLVDGEFKDLVTLLLEQLPALIISWEWGTTYNFLHQYQNSKVPEYLHTSENINLVDAGLFINVGYPSFLGDKRDIDLMIVLENSAGDMFETLIQGRDYAAQVKKPFPKIDDKVLEAERDFPNDCYVFEGKEKEPTIVYLPLFNRHNCKDAAEVKAKMEEYTTFQLPYGQEKLKSLLETTTENMKRNKVVLLEAVEKAAKRRKKKTGNN